MKLSLATATSLGLGLGLALWPAVIVVGAEQSLRRLGPGNGNGGGKGNAGTVCAAAGGCAPCCDNEGNENGGIFKTTTKSGECSLNCFAYVMGVSLIGSHHAMLLALLLVVVVTLLAIMTLVLAPRERRFSW